MSNPRGPYGPYNEAVKAALDAKPECVCERVDIGVGMQKVAEDPECPRCYREGEAAWYLQRMLPHIVKVEQERFDAVLAQALILPAWEEMEAELRDAFHSSPPTIVEGEPSKHTGLQAVYGVIQDTLMLALVQARAKLAGDE